MRPALVALVAAVALLVVPGAGAKNFKPGDLRLCNAKRCVVITNRTVLDQLADFYYGSSTLVNARRPLAGTPYYQLRFRNGYVTGIVATSRLSRFLSYGVNVGRFARGQWYGVPPRVSAELRRLSAGLRPLHLKR